MKKKIPMEKWSKLGLAAMAAGLSSLTAAEIIHDADHYVLKAQHGEQWAKDDKAVDAKLAEFKPDVY